MKPVTKETVRECLESSEDVQINLMESWKIREFKKVVQAFGQTDCGVSFRADFYKDPEIDENDNPSEYWVYWKVKILTKNEYVQHTRRLIEDAINQAIYDAVYNYFREEIHPMQYE